MVSIYWLTTYNMKKANNNQLMISEVNEVYLKRGQKKVTVAGPLNSPDEVVNVLRQMWGDDMDVVESFFIITLDVGNRVLGWAKISQGGISRTTIDTRIIAKTAIDALASGVIVAHNHPSGLLNFSTVDIKTTKTIKKALELFEITLLDHILLTEDGYKSYMEM